MTSENLFQVERQFIDAISQKQMPPLYEMTPKEAQQMLIEVQKNEINMPKVSYRRVDVAVGSGRKLPVLIVLPEEDFAELGMVYFIHGGGWVMGDISTHRRLIASLAIETPAALVVPLYQLSPEGQFPNILEDLYKGLRFATEHKYEYGIGNNKLAIMGDSVGGNMATVLTFMAKENGFTPSIGLQVLLYPVTAADFNTESYLTFADGPWLTRMAMQWFWDMYLPDKDKRYYKEASPLNAFIDDLSCLPPALIITAENDVLRDEGEAYARKLDEAGVPVVSVRFNGTMHDFMMLDALADTPATQASFAFIVNQLRRFLYDIK